MLKTKAKAAIGGGLVGLALLATTAGSALAQTTPTPTPVTVPTRAQMEQMMDAAFGQGASQRMYQAMGPDSKKLMDQMVTMMDTMQSGQRMQRMMQDQTTQSMQQMMAGPKTAQPAPAQIP